MKKTDGNQVLREYVHSEGNELRLDRENGILRNVKILGFVSRNGRRYSAEALQEAVSLYEGAKVNVNHPKGDPLSPRDYQDRIGNIQNVVFRPEEGLFADLYFNPHHQLAEQLIWDATNAPRNVGFSHNIRAKTVREKGALVVKQILAVQSVDLVADPATTSGLYESEGDEFGVKTAQAESLREEMDSVREELGLLQKQMAEFLRKNMSHQPPKSQEQETPFQRDALSTQDFVKRICR